MIVLATRSDRIWTVVVFGRGVGSGATFAAAYAAASRNLGGVS